MIQIRKATASDVTALQQLGSTVSEFSVNEDTVNFWPNDILLAAIIAEDVIILVAENNSRAIVGFMIANLNRSLRKALIENVYVKPDNRGAGVGEKLLRELLSMCKGRAIEYVATLIPLDATDASQLYESVGFSRGETFVWLDRPLSTAFTVH